VFLHLGVEALARQTPSRAHHVLRRLHLDPEVVEGTLHPGAPIGSRVLDEDELERRLDDREVGVAGADLRRLCVEELRVELNGTVQVGDVQGELDTGHRAPPVD